MAIEFNAMFHVFIYAIRLVALWLGDNFSPLVASGGQPGDCVPRAEGGGDVSAKIAAGRKWLLLKT